MLEFLGDLGRSCLLALRRPARCWADVTRLMNRHDGLPINALIGFLMGLITAFQAALQLHSSVPTCSSRTSWTSGSSGR